MHSRGKNSQTQNGSRGRQEPRSGYLSLNRDIVQELAGYSGAVVWEYDVQLDRYTYVDPLSEALLGYPPWEWHGLQSWLQRLHPEDRSRTLRASLAHARRGENYTLRYRFLKNNGEVIWLRDRAVVSLQNGLPSKLQGIMQETPSPTHSQAGSQPPRSPEWAQDPAGETRHKQFGRFSGITWNLVFDLLELQRQHQPIDPAPPLDPGKLTQLDESWHEPLCIQNLELPSRPENLDHLHEHLSNCVPHFPHGDLVTIGLHELVANAMDHGNHWQEGRSVRITLAVASRLALASVEDEGNGFNWGPTLNQSLDLKGDNDRGRGIQLANMCADYVLFNPRGNRAWLIFFSEEGRFCDQCPGT